MDGIFADIGIIIIMASLCGIIFRMFKQPLIPAYVLAGIVIGPSFLGLINSFDTIKVLAEIGIAFLLFVVGLELEIKKLKDIGFVSSIGGTLKLFIMFGLGYILAVTFGIFSPLESVYIGMILAFSSTMIVIKLISDKRQIDTLHGRIIIGTLLVEDVFAVLALSLLTAVNNFSMAFFFIAAAKGFMIIVAIIFSSRFIFPELFKFAAKSRELLFLLSVTMCFLFAIVISYVGFSIAIGAFAAGIALGNLPYNHHIAGRIKPLKDFFGTLFFASLGMQLVFTSLDSIILPVVILLVIVLLVKPLITMIITSLFGYKKRISFLTGISLAQVSEFSLIIVTQGLLLGHINNEIFSISVVLAVITIITTSYFIKYDNWLYHKLGVMLTPLDKFDKKERNLKYMPKHHRYQVILIGYDRIGYSILDMVKKLKKKILVVDYNPDIIKKLVKQNTPCIYGDISDPEILNHIDLSHAETIISTIPEKEDNTHLIQNVKEVNKRASIFVTANRVAEALTLYDRGADYVILPHFLGGHHVSLMLEDVTTDLSKLLKNKINHIAELKHRKGVGMEHPKHRASKEAV
ncbi:MAG: cation:proton antiporter [Candidatus Woesearchaeota archaeon]|jgi:Kef-type K+ transport system membrane component KefB/Trk K+ transport system NAD-binding subunit|nr:cation:proton antiporter [Candidatus Woesearchaeota archaeon]MDP7458102.1 cation:proton antiporter [Candidatus Woesearchaeota archaeon]